MTGTPTELGSPPLLQVTGLSITARLSDGERPITTDVDLVVRAGEAVAIVGESGSGKSLTARALLGLLPRGVAATGDVRYLGEPILGLPSRRLRKLRGEEMTFLPQDPFTVLNPVKRCGEQILEGIGNGRRKRSRDSTRREAGRRLAEVGIEDTWVLDAFPHELSGGMQQRVGIAAALARDPKVLIADEPSTALDVTTQRQCLDLLAQLREDRQMALILITHDLRVAFSTCSRVYVLYAGSVLEEGPTDALAAEPLHPYTHGLLRAEPPVDHRADSMEAIPGTLPQPQEVAGMCRFAPRCAWRVDACTTDEPKLVEFSDLRATRCLRVDDIREDLRARKTGHVIRRSDLDEADAGEDEALLDIAGLRVVYASRRGRHPVVAVDGLDLRMRQGESVGIVGESGSGKTTVSRCAVGLTAFTSGSLRLADMAFEAGRTPHRRNRRQIARVAQMVFQDPYSSLNPAMTVGQAIAEAAMYVPVSERISPTELLDQMGLPASYAARKPVALSGGERQRVAIARALSARPRLLVCDEPVSALDVSVQAQLLTLLRELRDRFDLSVLFISHDLAVVRQMVDRVYVMRRGVVVEHGQIDRVFNEPSHQYTRTLIDSIPRSLSPSSVHS